ncbi:MAG: hypothetical protein WCR46_22415 [Deltaproteobacteria bacterium]|jgi:carbamoyl-phosphate synthase large subunit
MKRLCDVVIVGITAVGSGIGQAVLDSLWSSKLRFDVIGFEANPWAKGIYECGGAFLLPYASDPSYKEVLLARCREASVHALIPGSDMELAVVAEVASDLRKQGCIPIVSDIACIRLCRDKLALYEHLSANGAPFVTTISLDQAWNRASDIPYPIIVKRRDGSGSVGVMLLTSCHDSTRRPLG